MRSILSLLFAVYLSINFVVAQSAEADNSTNSNDKNKAEIVFEKLVHDFGSIQLNSDGSCEFNFTNEGKSPLILSNVKSTCGCTIPSWTKEPIGKKGSGVIKVQYNTSRVGSFEKSITVYSNAKNDIVILTIKGKVEKGKDVFPIKEKSILSTE